MKKLERELRDLREQVVEMGNLTEKMVLQAIDALSDGNDQIIRTIMDDEQRLDQLQLEIDKEAIRILTIYSPVAGDLRFVLSVSRITSELERIGDHAVNMCESLQLMRSKADVVLLPDVQKMSDVVKEMISGALNAFTQNDTYKARSTIANDNIVDALNDQIVEELLDLKTIREVFTDDKDMAAPLSQLLIARSLERIADQATNISEEVVYMVKGDDIRHQELEGHDVRH